MQTEQGSELFGQLRAKNYGIIRSPLPRTVTESLVHSALDFFARPEHITIPFSQPQDVDLGYIRKQKANGDADNKQYFHYHPKAREIFAEPLSQVPVAQVLFEKAHRAYLLAENQAIDMLAEYDTQHPGVYEKFTNPDNTLKDARLRILGYDPSQEDEVIAAPHFDKSYFTVTIAQSKPGLRVGLTPEDLVEVHYPVGFSVLFIGIQKLEGVKDGIKPALHDVVQVGTDSVNPSVSRWSIIFFFQPGSAENISWQETHLPVDNQ